MPFGDENLNAEAPCKAAGIENCSHCSCRAASTDGVGRCLTPELENETACKVMENSSKKVVEQPDNYDSIGPTTKAASMFGLSCDDHDVRTSFEPVERHASPRNKDIKMKESTKSIAAVGDADRRNQALMSTASPPVAEKMDNESASYPEKDPTPKKYKAKKVVLSEAKRQKCYMWYARLGGPNREDMKKRVAALPDSCDITPEEVDELPWICNGLLLSIKEMNKLFMGEDEE